MCDLTAITIAGAARRWQRAPIATHLGAVRVKIAVDQAVAERVYKLEAGEHANCRPVGARERRARRAQRVDVGGRDYARAPQRR